MIEKNVLECVNPLLNRIQIRFAFTCANRDLKIALYGKRLYPQEIFL